jgi:putative endonuclease
MEKYKKTIGRFGEDLAEKFLAKRGYKIISRNVKISYWELDIITEKDKKIIFVEVKTLSTDKLGVAEDVLKHRQMKFLKKAISIYCWQNKINPNLIRPDFIAINLNRQKKTAKIKHYKNIF